MLSVLGLVKTEAAILAASECIEAAALHTIAHGNKRNYLDTLAALEAQGGKTKGGNIAKNRAGEIFAATFAALTSANSAAVALANVKGLPAFKEKAAAAAAAIAENFAEAAKPQPKAAKPKAAAAKPEAGKPEAGKPEAVELSDDEKAAAAEVTAAAAEAAKKAAAAAAKLEEEAAAAEAAAIAAEALPNNRAIKFLGVCNSIEEAAAALLTAAAAVSTWQAVDFAEVFAALSAAQDKAAAAAAAKPKAAAKKAAAKKAA